MFQQPISTAVLVLALAHGVMSAGPIKLQCEFPISLVVSFMMTHGTWRNRWTPLCSYYFWY
jgi:hypothetical protein